MISIVCGTCHKPLAVPDLARGMRIHCPWCKQQIVVPRQPPPSMAPSPIKQVPVPDPVPTKHRFPPWVMPSLAGVNGVLLLVFISVRSLPRTKQAAEPLVSPPLISNAAATGREAPVPEAPKNQPVRPSPRSQPLTAEQIYRECAPATVTIVGDDIRGESLGSGFFVSSDGYLLTNHHVVEGALRLYVVTKDNERLRAQVIDSWPAMDLAVIKVSSAKAPHISLSDSDTVEIGSSVVAIGTPQDVGLAQSITQGIVSGRRLVGGVPCYQTSALINHGNSGGPLLNMRGEVIGIATFVMGTALVTPQGNIGSDVQGINFAVEINLARKLLQKNGVVLK